MTIRPRRLPILGLVASLALVATALGACSRNDIEAVELANEGDKSLKMNPDEAISKYEQATKLDPSNALIFHKLGKAYQKKEAWDKVASTMATAIRLQPKNADFLYLRGEALARQAEKGPTPWDEAKDPLEKCIAADANYDGCYYELAEVNLHLGDEQRALENYTKAIQHNPRELVYYAPLADLYLNLGYVDQAMAVLKEGLNYVEPGRVGVYSLHERMAAALQMKGDLTGMAQELEKAKEADKENQHPEVLFALGSTYAVMNPPKKQEAQQMLKAFQTRGCKGAKAQAFKAQCDQAQTLLQKLGSS